MRTGSPAALTPHRRGSERGLGEFLPSSAGPGSLHLPCSSLPEVSRQSGGGGSSCRPHRGDSAPRGKVRVQHSRPRPRNGQGCAVAGLRGRSAPPPLPWGVPPPWAAPCPSRRTGMGEGLHAVTGARPGHAAHTLHFLRVSRKTKQDETKPPNPSKQKTKTHPKPRTRNTNKKLPFPLNSSFKLSWVSLSAR